MANRSNEWHLRDAETVAAILDSDIYNGLPPKKIPSRRRRDGKNRVWHVKHATAAEYLVSCAGDLTSAVLIIAVLTAAVFEKTIPAFSVCAILAIGIILRILTYALSRRTLEGMAEEGIPSATVLRGSVTHVIRADEIVVGDIILLEAGDIVPCDGRLVIGGEVRVSERGITENRSTVVKSNTVLVTESSGTEVPCEYRVNMLYAGSVILSGKCRMIATSCGEGTLVSMRHGGLSVPSGEKIAVIDSLRDKCRVMTLVMLASVLIISAVAAAFGYIFRREVGFAAAFINAMALAASSAGAYLLSGVYASLAVSLRRAARKGNILGKAVVKDASDVEKVARVRRMIVSGTDVFKSGRASYTSFFENGELKEVQKGDKEAERILRLVNSTVSFSYSSSLSSGEEKLPSGRSRLVAKLADMAKTLDIDGAPSFSDGEVIVDHKVTDTLNGDCDNIILRRGNSYEAYTSGRIEDILSFSSCYSMNGKKEPLTQEKRAEILAAVLEIEKSGGEVIAAAHRDSPYTTLRRVSVLQSDMCFDGFIVSEEETAACTGESINYMKETATSVILLSSRAQNDKYYLEKAGIVESKTPILSCSDVIRSSELPSGSFIVSVPESGENGRLNGNRNMRLAVVKKITEVFDNCAVMSSEPTDAGMMTDGNVGAALSRAGELPIPQTLKRRSVLSVYPRDKKNTCGGFNELIQAVYASGLALFNIQRSVLYLICSQCAKIVCTVLSVLFGINAVNAAEILLLGTVADFSALIVLAFSSAKPSELGKNSSMPILPIKKSLIRNALYGALCGAICFSFTAISSSLVPQGVTDGENISALCIALILTQLVILSEQLSEGSFLGRSVVINRAYIIYAVMTLVLAVALMFSAGVCSFLGASRPTWQTAAAAVVCAPLILASSEIYKRINAPKSKSEK